MWCIVIALVIGAVLFGLRFARRFRRVVQETKHVRLLAKEFGKRQDMIVKAPAHKALSDGFLQMAFGENPVLLEQIHRTLDTLRGSITGDMGMLLVTYRRDGNVVSDVAVHMFGNLEFGSKPTDANTVYELQRSLGTVLGRDRKSTRLNSSH